MHFPCPFSPEMCGRWTKPEKQISVFKQKRTDACGGGLRIEKCLLTQLVRIAVVKGSYPGKPEIFRLSFHNCINCLFLCVDLLYIIFFIPRFKCTKFINSSFFLTRLFTLFFKWRRTLTKLNFKESYPGSEIEREIGRHLLTFSITAGLFTVPHFSVRWSKSNAYRYGRPFLPPPPQ